jgi:hypothetical protein
MTVKKLADRERRKHATGMRLHERPAFASHGRVGFEFMDVSRPMTRFLRRKPLKMLHAVCKAAMFLRQIRSGSH